MRAENNGLVNRTVASVIEWEEAEIAKNKRLEIFCRDLHCLAEAKRYGHEKADVVGPARARLLAADKDELRTACGMALERAKTKAMRVD